MSDHDHTARNVVLVGGAALVAWLLLRGRSWGFGSGSSSAGNGDTGAAAPEPQGPIAPSVRRCQVWIRSTGVELDGVATDLPTIVTRCRAGGADVRATGDAREGLVRDTLRALNRGGVRMWLPPDLLNSHELVALKLSDLDGLVIPIL